VWFLRRWAHSSTGNGEWRTSVENTGIDCSISGGDAAYSNHLERPESNRPAPTDSGAGESYLPSWRR
jgi:hypothetical protein